MNIFSYHLLKTSIFSAIKIVFLTNNKKIKGLIHSESMLAMTLGAPVFSPFRILLGEVAFFAQWENETAIDNFLENNKLGKKLAKGWHIRLDFMRQLGKISKFQIPDTSDEFDIANHPVVAVTIARMKFLEIPRFIHWGRPVEKLVRDHPGTTLSLASIHLPQTVSTFSIWKTQKEMTDMVFGHSKVSFPKRHLNAMKERDRKDFHLEFTTLRFKPIAEHGEWKGKTKFVPTSID